MRSAQRVQRRRRRGWRMPAGAVYVGRPSIWGNPFAVSRSSDYHGLPGSWFVRAEDGSIHHPDQDTQSSARRKAVELYAWHVLEAQGARISVAMIRSDLAGHDLVCWCPRDEPCHADFLLTIANAPVPAAAEPDAGGVRLLRVPDTTCPSCGERLAVAGLHPRGSAGGLSVSDPAQLLVCVACGHEYA